MTARACPVSGCGSQVAYVDATTARADDWIRVAPARAPHGARWYCSTACAAAALAPQPGDVERTVRTALVEELTAAAARIAVLYPGDLLMRSRRIGLETARRITAPDRPDDDIAHCWLCGCTEDDACAGGCSWVPDPDGIRDVCSNCTDAAVPAGSACATPGCGTTDDLDPSDPAMWGWVRLEVAGTDGGPRWFCGAMCVGTAMVAAAAELVDADRQAAADATGVAR